MAITKITLKRDGGEELVLNYKVNFGQSGNQKTGQPTGEPVLNSLIIQILREPEADNNFYLNWQLQPTKKCNASLCFYDNTRLVRSWKITDAFLLSYSQEYVRTDGDGGQILETLGLSPIELEVDGAKFNRKAA